MIASAPQAAEPAATLSVSDSARSLHREEQKQHLQKQRLSLPCSSFHGLALSVNPVISQGLHGSFRAASLASSVNEVAVDGSANAIAVAASKIGVLILILVAVAVSKLDVEPKENFPEEPPATAKEASISSVMADVANLVKLVDSRDIVELEFKHLDFELVIRKKEALAPPPAPPNFPPPKIVSQAPYPAFAPLPPPPVTAPTPPTTYASASSSPAAAPVAPGSDLPQILSPMAGMFYKCAAPGEPPFVNVGDKVQKGQVICIVEAMKLMNEIEADQTGTIVEILAEDGKPVAVDTPLFVIKP